MLVAHGLDVLVTDVNETAAAERGPLQVWVNNAGILRTQKAWDHPDEDVRVMVEANLLGVLWGSRAAVEAMRPRRRRHRQHGLDVGVRAVPGLAIYGATKHAVRAFTESLQGDLDDARVPIRTHAICPAAVDTGMVRERQADEQAAIIFSAPRLMRPEEIAQKVGEVIGKRKPLVAIPTSRMVITRTLALFPNLSLRLLPLFKKQGEKKRASA